MRGILKKAAPVLVLAAVVLGLTWGWDLFVDETARRAPYFFDKANFGNILRSNSEKGFLAVGVTLVILAAGIDLSGGAVLGLGCMVSAMAIRAVGPWAGVAAGLGVGVAAGILNGAGVAYGKVPSFITTLATMGACRGLARVVHGGRPVEIGGTTPAPFNLLYTDIGDVLHVSGLLFLAAVAVTHLVLNRTAFGRHVYALGGNEEASRLCGLPIQRLKVMVFAIAGLLAGLAGLVYTARVAGGSPNAGTMYELDAIAMVVIGGTSLAGGKGGVLGTLYGFFLIGILTNVLTLRDVSSDIQLIVVGTVLFGAALLQARRKS
jgi:ribose/xylose/arabinose/galactoside ABC-type transport system permease subunit